jgi:hypothetical protein
VPSSGHVKGSGLSGYRSSAKGELNPVTRTKNWREEERKHMFSRKKLVVLVALVSIACLAVGAYAYTLLSNTITATWTVSVSGTSLTLKWNGQPTGGAINAGSWDYFGVEVQNPTAATFYNVIVTLTLVDAGPVMPTGCVHIQYWTGSAWSGDMDLSSWSGFGSSGTVSGILWNIGTVASSFDSTVQFRIMFDSTMPPGIVTASLVCSD